MAKQRRSDGRCKYVCKKKKGIRKLMKSIRYGSNIYMKDESNKNNNEKLRGVVAVVCT